MMGSKIVHSVASVLVLATLMPPPASSQVYTSPDGSFPSFGNELVPLANRTIVYGATIGSDWSALPTRKHIGFHSSDWLEVSGPIYLTGAYDSGNSLGYQEFSSPQTLVSQGWYDSFDQYSFNVSRGPESCMYHSCPVVGDTGSWSSTTGSCTQSFPDFSIGFEEPSGFVSDPATTLIKDSHGGSTADVNIRMETSKFVGNEFITYVILARWIRPGRYLDQNFNLDDFFPGDTFKTLFRYFGEDIILETKAVHHTSSDISGASHGFIDAADVAALASRLSSTSCIGYGTTGGCQTYNWYVDINVDGSDIDQSDLSLFASELDAEECADGLASKAGPFREAMWEWFGIRETGDMITVLGREVAEYEVYDWDQLAVGVANPYGYLANVQSAVEEMDWGNAKSLYR